MCAMDKKNQTKKKDVGGRPTKYNPKYHDPWVRSLAREGLSGKEIASELGIAESTLYKWASENPGFSECINQGRSLADSMVADSLYRKALGGTVKETRKVVIKDEKGGKESKHVEMVEVEREVMPDTGAAIFWLKNRQPDKWRDRREVETVLKEETIADELSETLKEIAKGM